jgi:hypothetical protein
MRWQRLGVTALVPLLLAGAGRLSAADQPAAKAHDRLEALGAKLGLSAEQKEAIRKIHAAYDQKEDKLEAEMRELRHRERDAAGQVLTEAQRAKARDLLKAAVEHELQEVAAKLGLSDEQKQKIAALRAEYDQKVRKLEGQQGEKAAAAVRDLRHQEFHAIGQELTEAQRAKAPGVLREELREWRNPAERREHLKGLADKLDLSAEQREKLQKIHADTDPKMDQLEAQLKELHREEHQAVEQVLTEEQRAKLQELRKARGGKKPQ